MFCLSKKHGQDLFMCNAILAVVAALILMSGNHNVSAMGLIKAVDRLKPTGEDFAICELSAEQKENFLDDHNKYRGMVDPPAADMEYMVSRASQVWLCIAN